jgi:hypothetical protein
MARSTTTRAALYARTSTADNDQDPELQLEDSPRLASQRGWTGAAEHVDKGISGARVQRPALDVRDGRPLREVVDGTGRSIWMVDGTGIPATHSGGPM